MSTCSRCGNQIEFRYIGGVCIPLHTNGNCINSGTRKVNDYSGYKVSEKTCCFCTNCPQCGDEVHFIRHNGGSVWIDPPLGPPWSKHSCFENALLNNSRTSLLTDYKIFSEKTELATRQDLIIGIIKSTKVDIIKRFTDIIFETGKNETKKIRLKNNAGFLYEKLCIYDEVNAEVWPIEEPEYIFAIYKPSNSEKKARIKCPKCGVSLNPKNLYDHLRIQHDITLTVASTSKSKP